MASDYEESMFGWGYCMPEAIADALVRHGGLQMEASILDLGCGNGLCGQALYNRGIKDINGIDFSRCVRKSNNKDTIHLRDSISKPWKNMRRTCHILYYYRFIVWRCAFRQRFRGRIWESRNPRQYISDQKVIRKKKCIFGEKRTLAALCFLKTNVIFFRLSTVLILPCTLCITV